MEEPTIPLYSSLIAVGLIAMIPISYSLAKSVRALYKDWKRSKQLSLASIECEFRTRRTMYHPFSDRTILHVLGEEKYHGPFTRRLFGRFMETNFPLIQHILGY